MSNKLGAHQSLINYCINGQGKYPFTNGDTYVGDWKDDKDTQE